MDSNELHGSCACDRNQYTIVVPSSSTSLAQVFFDNSAANRRSQATPVTAWLRIPLDWYHSTTFAHFPDETATSIKRVFTTHHSDHTRLYPTRRQFCGYCGTHLTAWTEGPDVVDVTLGSMYTESLELLERLKMYEDLDSDEEKVLVGERDARSTGADGRVKDAQASIHEDGHVGKQGPHGDVNQMSDVTAPQRHEDDITARPPVPHRMNYRGVPYFEEMVENSRLGRIKRQSGGASTLDGRVRVQWEVFDLGGDEKQPHGLGGGIATADRSKRLKMNT